MTELIQYIIHHIEYAYHAAVHAFQVVLTIVGALFAFNAFLCIPSPTKEEKAADDAAWDACKSNPMSQFYEGI
jgi:hypothetical protein